MVDEIQQHYILFRTVRSSLSLQSFSSVALMGEVGLRHNGLEVLTSNYLHKYQNKYVMAAPEISFLTEIGTLGCYY